MTSDITARLRQLKIESAALAKQAITELGQSLADLACAAREIAAEPDIYGSGYSEECRQLCQVIDGTLGRIAKLNGQQASERS